MATTHKVSHDFVHNFVQASKPGQRGLWMGGKAVAILSDLAKRVSSNPALIPKTSFRYPLRRGKFKQDRETGMSGKRKADVINNYGTINNTNYYFSKAPRPDPQPAAEPAPVVEGVAAQTWRPPPLSKEESKSGRIGQMMGGRIMILCSHHSCTIRKPAREFAPRRNEIQRAEYFEAIDSLNSAIEEKDDAALVQARSRIADLASTVCDHCKDIKKKSESNPDTAVGKCRAEWKRMRSPGGPFHFCVKCGATRAIEANHLQRFAENAKKYSKCVKEMGEEEAERQFSKEERKIMKLSDTTHWACPSYGGVVGMRLEAEKCEPLCSMCHSLDPSSRSSNERKTDPDNLKSGDYETVEKFKEAVRQAKCRKEKREYVNALKRASNGGLCSNPSCPRDGPSGGKCIEGFEQCYDCDHIDPKTKLHNIADLVRHVSKLDTVKPLIDAEWPKIRLLCKNCHVTRKKWDT